MSNRVPIDRQLLVYFAGKVNSPYEPDFWRRDWFGITQEDNGSISRQTFGEEYDACALYCGPTLSSNPEYDSHCNAAIHEAGAGQKAHNRGMAIYEQCLSQISQCDIVVARISEGAYATMFEVGYAEAIGKTVISFVETPDAWFANPGCLGHMIDFAEYKQQFVRHIKSTLAEHSFFYRWRKSKCESPIEVLVCDAMYRRWEWAIGDWQLLEPQFCISGYRIDLAIPKHKLAFEFDGFTYHSDKLSFNRDRERDRRLTDQGWAVIRFHGDEIRADASAVAKQIYQRLVNCREMEVQT